MDSKKQREYAARMFVRACDAACALIIAGHSHISVTYEGDDITIRSTAPAAIEAISFEMTIEDSDDGRNQSDPPSQKGNTP